MDLSPIINWLSSLPPQLATAIIAALPIAELRASIPVALVVYHLPVWQAVLFSVVGNCIPFIIILYLIDPVSRWCMQHSRLLARFFNLIFDHTRRKFSGSHAQYGAIALMIFVAIPLPLTGAWSGALAAWLFGIPRRLSIPFIAVGVLIAAIIVTVVTVGVAGVIRWIV